MGYAAVDSDEVVIVRVMRVLIISIVFSARLISRVGSERLRQSTAPTHEEVR